MADILQVLDVHQTDASLAEQRTGLLAYLTIDLPGGVTIKGATLRRTREGRRSISFPRNRHGYPYILLRTESAKRDLEHQIFEKLGIQPAHLPTNRTLDSREHRP